LSKSSSGLFLVISPFPRISPVPRFLATSLVLFFCLAPVFFLLVSFVQSFPAFPAPFPFSPHFFAGPFLVFSPPEFFFDNRAGPGLSRTTPPPLPSKKRFVRIPFFLSENDASFERPAPLLVLPTGSNVLSPKVLRKKPPIPPPASVGYPSPPRPICPPSWNPKRLRLPFLFPAPKSFFCGPED